MSLSSFTPHAAKSQRKQQQKSTAAASTSMPMPMSIKQSLDDEASESSWPQSSSLFNNKTPGQTPPFRLPRSADEEREKYEHLYVLPVLLLEFLAIALTRAVLPSILVQHYGNNVYLILGAADCIKGILAFLACPIFGKLSDIIGRRICLFVTVIGSCAPVCSLALFSWGDPTFDGLFGSSGTSFDPSDPAGSEGYGTRLLSTAGMNGNDGARNQEDPTPVLIQGDSEMIGGLVRQPLSANAITVFVIMLALSGIFSSTFTLVFAYISDTVRQRDERVAAYGLALATLGLSFTIGPMVGGYLAQEQSMHLVFICSLLLTIADAIYIYFFLPESKKDVTAGWSSATVMSIHEYPGTWSPLETIRLVAFDPFLRRVGQVAFLYYTGLWALISTLSLYAVQRFHLTPDRLGELMSALGLSTMVAEAVLVRILVPILGEKRSCRIGLFSFAVQCIVLGFAYEGWHLFICVAFSMLGNLVYPSLSSLVSGNVEPEAVGEALGAVNGIKALTEGIGPLVFGSLMTISEKSALPGWPYLVASLLVFGAYHMSAELPDLEDDEYIHELEVKYRKQSPDTTFDNVSMVQMGALMSPSQGDSNTDDREYVRLLSEIDTSEDEHEFAMGSHIDGGGRNDNVAGAI